MLENAAPGLSPVRSSALLIPFALSLCAFPSAAEAQAKPPLIVQYHVWYDTSYGPQSAVWPTTARSDQRALDWVWGVWDRREFVAGSSSPETVTSNGWIRASTHTRDYYPMIGLYDPDDREVLRWHIRLAKAAGVDAFAISLYDSWYKPPEYRWAEIFRNALEVAREENFKLSWEVWWGGNDLPGFFEAYEDLLAHPNFYRVRYEGADLPLIWIAPGRAPANFFGDTVPQFDAIIRSIEARIGPCVWAINNGTGLDYSTSTVRKVLMSSGNLFYPGGDAQWAQDTRSFVSAMRGRGVRVGTHVYPGFDELDMRPADKRYHPRQGGETLNFALATSAGAGAEFTFLESWNDFGESTAIEPGFKEDTYEGAYAGDLYKDLRIVAAHKGVSFSPPVLPPDSSIDPLVLAHLGRKQRFAATVGLGAGASASNGVQYSLWGWFSGKWVTLATRLVRPTDGTVAMNVDMPPFFGRARTLILGVDTNGDSGWDWAHWASASVESGGTNVDLVARAPGANWQSPTGPIPWGTASAQGTATYAYDQTLTDGRRFGRTLYTHPSLESNGFAHGGYRVDIVPGANAHRVTFRATAALGDGALCSNGVLFGLFGWNGTSWVSLGNRLIRPADGTVTFTSDLSGWYGGGRSFILGADAYGDPSCDWAYFGEAYIQVDGRTVWNFVASAPSANWHSTVGTFPWGTASSNGSAYYANNARMMGGRVFGRAVYLHPNLVSNGFSHGGYYLVLQ